MTERAGLPVSHPAAELVALGWAKAPASCILDTGFADGQAFVEIWQRWRSQAEKPAVLHYVAVLSQADAAQLQDRLLLQSARGAATAALTQTLANQCYGLDKGFHRILLDGGYVSLTLCVGALQTMLAQQDMQADVILAGQGAEHWDKWLLKALARNCRRGTALVIVDQATPAAPLLAELGDAGFELQPPNAGSHTLQAQYNPRWTLSTSRHAVPATPRAPGRCAVIGAGIAGASVANALAVRGWHVDVLDAHATPAGGASGLPVGLVVPHHSADDSPRSRMSRSGTRLTLQHARRCLQQGQDWDPSGVLELDVDAHDLDATEAEVQSPDRSAATASGWASPLRYGEAQGLWHPYAAWIKPQRLVTQWLQHPNIHFHGNAAIQGMERSGVQWLLRDAQGQILLADTVIFANAFGCVALLRSMVAALPAGYPWVPGLSHKLAAMQAMHGTLSMGLCDEAQAHAQGIEVPHFPVNGHGSLVWDVPTAQGHYWYAGATFEADAGLHADIHHAHAINWNKLERLLPDVAHAVSAQFTSKQVQAWQGSRCVTHDRLPLAGPLEQGAEPTLWMVAGMGARGLSFSALCAELLVAQMCGEPMPLEASLRKALDTRRFVRKGPTPD